MNTTGMITQKSKDILLHIDNMIRYGRCRVDQFEKELNEISDIYQSSKSMLLAKTKIQELVINIEAISIEVLGKVRANAAHLINISKLVEAKKDIIFLINHIKDWLNAREMQKSKLAAIIIDYLQERDTKFIRRINEISDKYEFSVDLAAGDEELKQLVYELDPKVLKSQKPDKKQNAININNIKNNIEKSDKFHSTIIGIIIAVAAAGIIYYFGWT